jgi:hypothetical protein
MLNTLKTRYLSHLYKFGMSLQVKAISFVENTIWVSVTIYYYYLPSRYYFVTIFIFLYYFVTVVLKNHFNNENHIMVAKYRL